ncbi:MAG: hypothetical protein ABIO36_09420 [Pyrinomonadaceae bacterium]
MNKVPIDWIAFFLFVFLFIGVMVAEVKWLARKGWAVSGRAVGYVMVTDLLGIGIGSSVVFVIFFIMFMMVMGPAGRGGTAPEFAYWITTAIAIILPPIIFVVLKRLFLLIFKIRSGKEAWVYSIVSSILMILVVLVPPPLLYFGFVYLAEWK